MLRLQTASLASVKRSTTLEAREQRRPASTVSYLTPPIERKATFEEAIKEPPKWLPFGMRPAENSLEWKWWMRHLKRRLPKGRYLARNQQSLKNPFIPDRPQAQRVRPELLKGNPISDPSPVYSKAQKYDEKFVSLPVGYASRFCLDFRVNQNHINYNAVNYEMLRTMRQYFDKWERSGFYTSIIWSPSLLHDPKNEHLCAGADIWSLIESPKLAKQFYREQAEMINEIYYMRKPVIAFIHGRAHGVGAGMALFQTMPMVTPSAVVSSPGCRYGMSGADAGLSYLFSRLPGHLGEFYLLTGKNITGSDLIHLGLARFYMKDFENIGPMHEQLANNDSHDLHQILEFVKMFTNPPEPSQIARFADIINHCFSQNTIVDIVASLREQHLAWTNTVANIITSLDPAVATATLLACRRARHLNISECLEMEYTLAHRLIDRPGWKDSVVRRLAPRLYKKSKAVRSISSRPGNAPDVTQLWKQPYEEIRAAAEALLAPLPANQRLNLPVKTNLEHYQRRQDYESEKARSHEIETSRADLHNALEEVSGEFRNGKVTRNGMKRFIMKTLGDMPEVRRDLVAFQHQVHNKSLLLVESGLWGIVTKQTST